MIIGTAKDKSIVVDILAESYDDNETINETILPSKRKERLRGLMEYSIEAALTAGKVCLSDDRQAVALILFPDHSRPVLRSIYLDIQLLFRITGWRRALKALSREKMQLRNYVPINTCTISGIWVYVKPLLEKEPERA
ncbi:MAG TPA: hypothetical protein VM802_00290 [Chitinophaga sp.]|uniref:hypothetical protein n=1 Tax=Chitinophaga sp. TaxID=1869181 RepID=UPI002C2157CA|nr:hypothetical protein [Chitinophaga sp.]HVI43267.1 hypothetical protein [Chitinophaga sp.]